MTSRPINKHSKHVSNFENLSGFNGSKISLHSTQGIINYGNITTRNYRN